MYWPLLLAAWYSSAGMVRNLSVFIGAPWLVLVLGSLLPVTDVLKKNRVEGRRNREFYRKKCGLSTKMPSGGGIQRAGCGLWLLEARITVEMACLMPIWKIFREILRSGQNISRYWHCNRHLRDYIIEVFHVAALCDRNPSTRSNQSPENSIFSFIT